MINLPAKVEEKLEELKIPSSLVSYSFESASAKEHGTGGSWLIFTRKNDGKLFVLSGPPLGDLELVGEAEIRQIKEITFSANFLGNLEVLFFGKGGNLLATFCVPSLQKSSWDDLERNLEIITALEIRRDIENFGVIVGEYNIGHNEYSLTISNYDIGQLGSSLTISDYNIGKMDKPLDISKPTLNASGGLQFGKPVKVAEDLNKAMDRLMIQETSIAMEPISVKIEEAPSAELAISQPSRIQGKTQTRGKEKRSVKPQHAASQEEGTKCKKCGQMNKPDYIYCLGCGAQVGNPPVAAPRKSSFGREAYGSSVEMEEEQGSCVTGCIYQLFMVFIFVIGISILMSFF